MLRGLWSIAMRRTEWLARPWWIIVLAVLNGGFLLAGLFSLGWYRSMLTPLANFKLVESDGVVVAEPQDMFGGTADVRVSRGWTNRGLWFVTERSRWIHCSDMRPGSSKLTERERLAVAQALAGLPRYTTERFDAIATKGEWRESRPDPLGYALNVLHLALIAALARSLAGLPAWNRRRRIGARELALLARRCPTCGYNIEGLRHPLCPECGSDLTLRNGSPAPPA